MVQIRNTTPRHDDGNIDIDAWFSNITEKRGNAAARLIRNAYFLAQLTGGEQHTFSGQSCLHQGLEMAELLLDLNCDHETVAAGLVYCCAQFAELTNDDIKEHLGVNIARLVSGVEQMDVLHSLHASTPYKEDNRNQIDNLRKMLLAMAQDVRVVFIKLVERACVLRNIRNASAERSCHVGQEILDIYAPLANRLGIGQLKWEMEDLSFRYCQPEIYKKIAKQLQERRLDREDYVQNVIKQLEALVHDINVEGVQIQGRVKHIFSIYRKMQRKNVDLDEIYDATAVRVLVPNIEDCYAVLGAVHNQWKHIPEEFDDYVTTPKENGYQSIHTAVYGPKNKVIEVQIRTFTMHEESELGVAAHWMYKEGRQHKSSYQDKITWLRQIIEWQKEMAHSDTELEEVQTEVTEDRVYVITPAGDVVDLPKQATPLDFAYNIHSEIGHRCRGAKINGKIVPLTYQLNTGDQVEILTQKQPNPSRDWLNPHAHYLVSSRAKAKIHHWFKQQDYDQHLIAGQELIQEELKRAHIKFDAFDKLAPTLNFKTGNDLLAGLGNGDLRTGQIINAIRAEQTETVTEHVVPLKKPQSETNKKPAHDVHIEGVDSLLSHIAKCCKPLPGDEIQGYITKGRGISIHRHDCTNVKHIDKENQDRLVSVTWGSTPQKVYVVDLYIESSHQHDLVREITTAISQEKMAILSLNSRCNKKTNLDYVDLTLEISDLDRLKHIIERIKKIDGILVVNRQK